MKVLSKMASARIMSKKNVFLTYLSTLVFITTMFTLAEAQVFGPVKVSNSGNAAVNSEIAVFENGDCVVTWQEASADIKWRRLNSTGSAIDNITQANINTGTMADPDVATSANHCFATVWKENLSGARCSDDCEGKYWLREFDRDGVPIDTAMHINNSDLPEAHAEGPPFITYGDIVEYDLDMPWWGVTWQPDEPSPNSENVHFNSYSSWINYWVRVEQYRVPYGPIGISTMNSGEELRYIIFYKQPTCNDFRARKVDRWGMLDPVIYTFTVPATGAICGSKATMNAPGRIGVVWVEHDGMSSEIFLQQYVLTGDEIQSYGSRREVLSTEEWVDNVAISPCGTGFAVAWDQADDWNGTASDIYVRRIYTTYMGGIKRIDNDDDTEDIDPSLQLRGSMCYVSWTKTETGQSFGEIYASKINLGIQTPIIRVTQ